MALPVIESRLFTPNAPDEKEISRYLRTNELSAEQKELLRAALGEQLPLLEYKAVFAELPLPNLLFSMGSVLEKRLVDCDKILLFAATVGTAPDRLIAKYRHVSPVKALFHQAVGAERVEAVCDCLCRELQKGYEKTGYRLLPRFSPGYADFPLTSQKEIFAVLDLPRRAGITLTEGYLMIPTKSVTGIIGLKKEERQ